MATFALSRGKPPYKIAVYAPGQKVQWCSLMHYIIASTYTYHNELFKCINFPSQEPIPFTHSFAHGEKLGMRLWVVVYWWTTGCYTVPREHPPLSDCTSIHDSRDLELLWLPRVSIGQTLSAFCGTTKVGLATIFQLCNLGWYTDRFCAIHANKNIRH